jgi:hypothetical protein
VRFVVLLGAQKYHTQIGVLFLDFAKKMWMWVVCVENAPGPPPPFFSARPGWESGATTWLVDPLGRGVAVAACLAVHRSREAPHA